MATTTLNLNQNLDAFGRLRVSELTTLIDIKQIHDEAPIFIDQVQNATGSSVYNTGESSTTLSTSASGDYAISQTKQRFNYQSGKSHFINFTMYGFEAQANVTKRIGYFSSATTGNYDTALDGLFMESDGSSVSTNIYRNGTLIAQTLQADWDDPLNGTGASGITVDWSKDQIILVDFQWLGVGRVRWYVDIDGVAYLFHESKHANVIEKVYMKSPNQPLRWEIRQTGAGSGAMTYVCASVSSEGAQNIIGKSFSEDLAEAYVNANTSGTYYALLGIELQATKVDALIDVIDFSMLVGTNDNVHWELLLNPSVAGTFNYVAQSNSAVSIAKGDTAGNPSTNTVTGGTRLSSGYVKGGNNSGDFDKEIQNAIRLGVTIAGVTDNIVLVCTPMTGDANLDVSGSIGWREQI